MTITWTTALSSVIAALGLKMLDRRAIIRHGFRYCRILLLRTYNSEDDDILMNRQSLFCFLLISLYVPCVFAADTLSLDDAIQLALTQNTQLQSTRESVTSANIALESAKSQFNIQIRPDISGLLQSGDNVEQRYGVQLGKKFAIGGDLGWQANTRIDQSSTDSYRTELTLSYTQPLLKGRGTLATTAEVTAAERRTRSQYRALLLAQQQLLINVATAYYGILRDQLLLEANQRAVERARLLLQAAEAKLKVGMASKMDVFRSELQVLTAESGLVDAEESLHNTRQRLNILLGTDLNAEFTLSTPMTCEPVEMLDQDALVQQAFDTRLEMQDVYENLQEAEQRLQIARQNQYPPLDLSVHYTVSGEGNGFQESLDLNDTSWGAGVNTSFDFNFTRQQGAYQQAQLAYNGAARAIEAKEQDILLEVLRAINSVRQAQARIALQEQSVIQAEKQLELAELRYKKGLSDNLDVIDAEEAVLKAKTGYYSAVVQHILAKLTLKHVTGALDVPF